MASRDVADPLTALLSGLEVGTAADVAAARALSRLDPVEAVHALRVLVQGAKRSPRAGKALVLATRALAFGPDEVLSPEQRGRIYDAAVEFAVPEVSALFLREAPSLEVDPGLVDRPDPVIGHLTLGHKKMLARKIGGDRLARFAMEPDACVIRELLLNPRLTEEGVVRIAARRPARVAVLMEIWRSRRWCVRREVRRALAMNPYCPPEVGLKLLPHLERADLLAIAGDGTLHASLRVLAARLAEGGRALGAGPALDHPAEQVAEPGQPAGERDQRQHDQQEDDLVAGQVEGHHRRSD